MELLLTIIIILLHSTLICADTSAPITKEEWSDAKFKYLKLYQNGTTVNKAAAIKNISDLYNRLAESNDDFALEALEFLLWLLTVEKEEPVLNDIKACIGKFSKLAYVEWLGKNYQRLVNTEATKLQFVETLGIMTGPKNNAVVSAICRDLWEQDGSPAVKNAAKNMMIKTSAGTALDDLASLASNSDLDVSKAALKTLGDIYAWEKVRELITLLDTKELNNNVRKELISTLEKITGQNIGDKPPDWQKWWDTKPQIPDVALKYIVNRSIKKGFDYLIRRCMTADPRTALPVSSNTGELIFYTLVKSGQDFPASLQKLFIQELLNRNLANTYNVALLVMAFAELDKVKYLEHIAQCAQFLLANQTKAGGWCYTMKTPQKLVLTDLPKQKTPVSGTSTVPVKKITIKESRITVPEDQGSWDTSIAQYAVLGLRACAESDIDIPAETWRDAEQAFSKHQQADGGWGCCYSEKTSSHAMAVAGLGSLAICLYFQGKGAQDNASVQKALKWMEKNFAIPPAIPGHGTIGYYLYGIERAGTLLGTESFGSQGWYPLGARYLLDLQRADGSWSSEIDTCFAILFLCRATKPLKIVITEPTDKKDK